MTQYTIAICNLNMVETVKTSVKSILKEIRNHDEFEILLLDGGSDDGSKKIIRQLAEDYSQIRPIFVEPKPGETRYLGADRNRSFEEARGEYIIHQFDTDDIFVGELLDLVKVYHQVEEVLGKQVAMNAGGINIAPRELLIEHPYHNLTGSEDKDFWRRLIADDAFVWLEANDQTESIGYDRDWKQTLNRWWEAEVANMQVGISFWSYLHFLIETLRVNNDYPYRYSWKRVLIDAVRLPFAYLEGQYRRERINSTPSEFKRMGHLPEWINQNRKSLSEFENYYNVNIDRSGLDNNPFSQ